MRISVLLSALLIVTGFMSSCQKGLHQKGEFYYLVANSQESPYWKEVRYGFKAGVRSLGFPVEGEVVGPKTRDVEAQLEAFRKAVAAKPNGILVSPADPEAFVEDINQAVAQGIPVICIDSDAPLSRRIMFIGTDNYRAGFEGGELTAKILAQRGNVLVLTVPGQHNLDERVRGYKDALKKHRRIKILSILNNEGRIQKSNDLISKLMDQPGEPIDIIICMEANGGEGVAEALYRIDLHGKIPIIAMDKNPLTLEWIRRGGIKLTVSQKPHTMGFYGVKYLDDLNHNAVRQFKDWRTAPVSPVPTQVTTGTFIVDKDNLEAFQASLPPPPSLLEED